MTDRIRVTMAVDLFVDDEQAMREKAFATLRDAWDSEDEFPYSSASDVPLAQVINSVLAAALSLDLPGGRRGRLEVDAVGDKQSVETSEDDSSDDTGDDRDSDRGADSERDVDSGPDAESDSRDDSGEADRPEEPDGAEENRARPEEP
jgi:hypothetical protein